MATKVSWAWLWCCMPLASRAWRRQGGVWSKLAVMQAFKLLIIPALSFALLWAAGVEGLLWTVAVLLLSSPTATLTVIMAKQLGGDADLSSQAISISHVLSVLGYSFWLWLLIS
jgi:predicted permease